MKAILALSINAILLALMFLYLSQMYLAIFLGASLLSMVFLLFVASTEYCKTKS